MKLSALSLALQILLVTLTVATPRNHILFLGGKGTKGVQLYALYKQPQGNCSLIPDVPFEPLHSIGLRDNLGRAMVCGGSKNPKPKSCYVLDRSSNSWIPGPELKRQRVGASATCLDNGVCWVFGGKKKSFTEWYNPETNEFKMGPEMPINNAHGLCSAVAESGLIFVAINVKRNTDETNVYTFDPETKVFTHIHTLNQGIQYAACGAFLFDIGGMEFALVGGIRKDNNRLYILSPSRPLSTNKYYPPVHQVFGQVGIPVDAESTFMLAGGMAPDGEMPTKVYSYSWERRNFIQQAGFKLDPPRLFPIAVPVHEEDCPNSI